MMAHVIEVTEPGAELHAAAAETGEFPAAGEAPIRDGTHFLGNEERAKVQPALVGHHQDLAWYLDSGATNHMTGNRDAFAELDEKVSGKVRFGDGSVVTICGRGTVLFTIGGGAHRAFTDVFFIPALKSSVVSIGQLDENWYEVKIRRGILTIRDPNDRLIAKVPRLPNRLYKLTAQHDSISWRWHARLGHLHFDAMQKMARGGLVRGLLSIEPVEQLCEACLTGKQRRTPFPQKSKFRASDPLELVHGDLCGPIAPATPGGCRYFLLLVDDHSRYMWISLLATKDEAAKAIMQFQALTENESGRKLCTLRTDRQFIGDRRPC